MDDEILCDLYKKYEPLFGSWYIKKKIAHGTSGQVFEIECEESGQTKHAAVKIITLPESLDDVKRLMSTGAQREDVIDYYRNKVRNISKEIEFLSQFKGCRYIVNYHDHQIKEDPSALTWVVLIKTELLTPLVDGSLKNPLGESDVVKLGIDICKALEICAERNIIHRDIKPENIFIGPDGDYKLGDFGIARFIDETQINLSRKGTYTFMAPEVFHGKPYGQTADICSLGIVMYKYLNHGRGPFMPDYPKRLACDDVEAAFSQRMTGRELTPPATGSGRLAQIVLKACAFDPADRYQTASEMLADLEELYSEMSKHTGLGAGNNSSDTGSAEEEQNHSSFLRIILSNPGSNASDHAGRFTDPDSERRHISNKRPGRPRILASIVTLCMIIAAVYLFIPKEVTGITGINDHVCMTCDETMSPEYTVEPSWFKDEPIIFVSTNEDILSVSEEGRLQALSEGEADLVIHSMRYTRKVHVEVLPCSAQPSAGYETVRVPIMTQIHRLTSRAKQASMDSSLHLRAFLQRQPDSIEL